jgi:PAS domain S-box-containing protein
MQRDIAMSDRTEAATQILAEDASRPSPPTDARLQPFLCESHEGLVFAWNAVAEQFYGIGAGEILGQPVSRIMPKEVYLSHRVAVHDALNGEPVRRRDERHVAAWGETRDVKVDICPLRDESGMTPGVMVVVHPGPSEGSFETSAVSGHEVHISPLPARKDPGRKERGDVLQRALAGLDWRNRELACLSEVSKTARSQEGLSDLFSEIVRCVGRALGNPESTRARMAFDGELFPSDDSREGQSILSVDITVAGKTRGWLEAHRLGGALHAEDEPRLEEERRLFETVADILGDTVARREAEAQVIQASKLASIGELAAGVSHEINNPVNGIMNCAEILAQQLELDSKNRKLVELINSEAERIAEMVRGLLSFARQGTDHHSPARLCDIVRAALALTRKKIAGSCIDLRVEVPEDLPQISCRSEQIQQVVMNLIINSVHALDERYAGCNEDKALVIAARRISELGTGYLRLTVEDNGCGIEPAHLPRLFDPFFTTKGSGKGTGLGLSVSKRIVKDHGGRIRVESERGRHTRFHVDLPLEPLWTESNTQDS